MFAGPQVIGEEGEYTSPTLFVDKVKVRSLEHLGSGACADPSHDDKDWMGIKFSDIPQNTHLCVRKWFEFNDKQVPANPALLIGLLASTNIYWDGHLLFRNGVPASTADNERAGSVQSLKRLPISYVQPGRHLLSIELSSFQVGAQLEGIAYVLAIVNEQNLQKTILSISIISALLAGSLIILAIFFQMLFSLYYRDRSFQIFSVLCLSATLLLIAEQWKLWVFYPYDWHVTRINLVLAFTFLTSFLLPSFYIYYYRGLGGGNKLNVKLIVLLAGLFLAAFLPAGFDQKSLYLFGFSIVASLMVCVEALIRRRSGAGFSFVLLALSFLCLIELPFIFTEFGFASMLALLMPAMLINLIAELRRNRDKALTAERMKSELLRRNLQPHFLMNSLTHLLELIEVLPVQAVAFVTQLADEFRLLLRLSNKNVISLDDELALCRSHLNIMSSRYQKSFSLNVVGPVSQVSIPSAILHSQIENCFTHNRISSDRTFELEVELSACRVNLLLKTPTDDPLEHDSTGLGDAYVKAKLSETCVSDWRFTWERQADVWLVMIEYEILPKLLIPEEANSCT
jgi:hypothetical protein